MNEETTQTTQSEVPTFKKIQSEVDVDDKHGFYITNVLQGTAAATAGNYNHFFTAAHPCEVKKIIVNFSVVPAGNCRLQFQKLTTGVASPAGGSANILVTNIRLDTYAADTPIKVEYPNLIRTTSACKLKEGDRLSMYIDAGSPAGMENLSVTVYLTPSGRGHYI